MSYKMELNSYIKHVYTKFLTWVELGAELSAVEGAKETSDKVPCKKCILTV